MVQFTTDLPEPTNVSPTVSNGDDIDLSWTDNSNNENGFDILREYDNNGYSQIASVGANVTSYSDTGLLDGEQYSYKIRVFSDHATSTSTAGSATTTLPAPSGISATADSSDQITVSWTDNSDNTSSFILYRGTSSGSLSQLTTLSSNTTSYANSGLTDGKEYFYRIEASTEHTTSSSSTVSAITVLPAPSTVSVSNITDTSADVSWTDNADGEVGYRVLVSTDGGTTSTDISGLLAANSSSYSASTLSNGKQYIAIVRAVGEDATAETSSSSFTTTLPAPSSFSATVDTQNYDEVGVLSWVNNYTTSNVTTNILRSQSSGSTSADYTIVDTVSNGVGSYDDATVSEDQTYYYRVEAVTSDASKISSEDSIFTDLVGSVGETDNSLHVRKTASNAVSRTDQSK